MVISNELNNKTLVVVQLNGGNDFMNTVVPYGNGLYRDFRPIVGVDQEHITPIDDYIGFNNDVAPINDLYNKGEPKQIHVSNEKKYLISTTSRSHNNEKTDNYLKNYKIKDKIICGSSLKFCLIANGTADIYPRLGPTCEWDTAAGHAILNGAGGSLKKLNGDNFLYGKLDKDFLNPEFIATNF